jgi:hypothetical protein
MGFMAEGQVRDAVNKHGQKQTELLATLVAEVQRANELLSCLVQALGGPQGASQSPTWARH